MAYRRSKISAMVVADPARASDSMVRAFERAKAHQGRAAKLLGISQFTFSRYVTKLGIRARLDRVKERAEREGWHHDMGRRGGRPSAGATA